MSKKANKTTIGAFVVGAAILLVMAILAFGSGIFFKRTSRYVLFFDTATKGLSAGSPVIFRGVKVGSVKDISLFYNQETKAVLIPVMIEVDSSRLRDVPAKGTRPCKDCNDYTFLVKQGLRARLVMQSFLTGELMVAFDFYPDKPANLYGIITTYPELPTLPVAEISESLENTLAGINKFVNSGNVQDTLWELNNTLRTVNQSARSLRMLTEYLEEHPEAFLKGKSLPGGE